MSQTFVGRKSESQGLTPKIAEFLMSELRLRPPKRNSKDTSETTQVEVTVICAADASDWRAGECAAAAAREWFDRKRGWRRKDPLRPNLQPWRGHRRRRCDAAAEIDDQIGFVPGFIGNGLGRKAGGGVTVAHERFLGFVGDFAERIKAGAGGFQNIGGIVRSNGFGHGAAAGVAKADEEDTQFFSGHERSWSRMQPWRGNVGGR